MEKILPLLFGVLFVVLGIYLPKCKQNYTMGIKLPWTIHDEENWDYTHRIGGKVWVVAGILMLLCVVLPNDIAFTGMMVICALAVGIPTICSYLFYCKKKKEQS